MYIISCVTCNDISQVNFSLSEEAPTSQMRESEGFLRRDVVRGVTLRDDFDGFGGGVVAFDELDGYGGGYGNGGYGGYGGLGEPYNGGYGGYGGGYSFGELSNNDFYAGGPETSVISSNFTGPNIRAEEDGLSIANNTELQGEWSWSALQIFGDSAETLEADWYNAQKKSQGKTKYYTSIVHKGTAPLKKLHSRL